MQNESITLNNILEEIIKTKNDLKSAIEASETRVLLKIETVKNRVTTLEKENLELRNKVESLERKNKKNNIVIFGIRKPYNEITAQYICEEIRNLLEVNLSESDLNDVYSLGKKDNSPIKVELISQMKKNLILKNCYKLKGKNISISQDLTETQRGESKILRKHLREAQQNKTNKCYIKGNKLIINNITYTANELQDLENTDDTIEERHNSAPATPSGTPRNLKLVEKETDPAQQQTKNSFQKQLQGNSESGTTANTKLKKTAAPLLEKIATRSITTKSK